MSDNKNLPAFPTITWDQLESGQIYQSTDEPGVTKLEFFACNAPYEIPSFFVHTPPEKNITPMPDWRDLPQESQEPVRGWFEHGQELPDELKWFSDQYKKYEEEDRTYRFADSAARYFQWRKYYAEQLLSELSKS